MINPADKALTAQTINTSTYNFLKTELPTIPVFYFLPKIHKNLHNPPGCPVAASTDSVFSPLAKHLKKILKPLIKNTPLYLRDTGHFLDVLKQITHVPTGSILVTMDDDSLYTSIKHNLGIQATHSLLINSASNLSSTDIKFALAFSRSF